MINAASGIQRSRMYRLTMKDNNSSPEIVPVSVVIPCYKCSDTVERAIRSVADQSRRPEELILVLDGPDDHLLNILKTLRVRYGEDWIHIIALDSNSGPSVARNAGWDSASQRYIALLDADDAWHPRKIEIQLDYMETHPEVSLTGHGCRLLRTMEEPSSIPEHYHVKHTSFARALLSNPIPTRSAMFHRELPFRFTTEKRYCKDYLLWLHILGSGYRAAVIDLELAYLFKAAYGEGGLSGNLLRQERNELDNYRHLWRDGVIRLPLLVPLILWSLAKCARRVAITLLRNLRAACPLTTAGNGATTSE
jgi:glycosyltransferase involved in cell wall biosynthesis